MQRRRRELGLSIRAVAEQSGLPSTTVFRIESGEIASPKPQQLDRIAHVLKVDVEDYYALMGYLTPDALPSLQPYLRVKYNLPPQAARQIDEYFSALHDRWMNEQDKEQRDDDRGDNAAT
jgi:transcriptional regulator with XRE-family HTH domain